MQVNHFLENSAQKYPDKKAVWYKDSWMTFGEIEEKSNRLANYLKSCSIRRGDRVALLLENSHDYLISYYGILKAGAVTVALNTETTTDTLIYLLNDCEARAIITQKKYARHLAPALPKVPYLRVVIADHEKLDAYQAIGHCEPVWLNEILENGDNMMAGVRGIDIDLASLVYTSGSTGKSKAVVLTHLNIISNTRSIVEYLELTAEDRVMVVLPFYYIYGKSLLNTHFSIGGSVVLDNRFAFPNVILETMQRTDVTGFSGVPSTFMILLNKSTLRQYNFEKLRYITQAGGAMAPAVQKKVAQVFAPAKLYIMYGATEASARLSYLHPDELPDKWGSIGKAIPNVDLFVADEKGNPVPHGTEGEIVARGSNLMQGYWNDLEATQEVLRNGLYHTGDIGKIDEEGFIYVVGRKKDMIKVGGERVSAKEIEEAILELKEIKEVAVIGVSDATLGEAIKVFLVAKNKSESLLNSVKLFCQKKLPKYKQPKSYVFIEDLPKNESGKIIKRYLQNVKNNI